MVCVDLHLYRCIAIVDRKFYEKTPLPPPLCVRRVVHTEGVDPSIRSRLSSAAATYIDDVIDRAGNDEADAIELANTLKVRTVFGGSQTDGSARCPIHLGHVHGVASRLLCCSLELLLPLQEYFSTRSGVDLDGPTMCPLNESDLVATLMRIGRALVSQGISSWARSQLIQLATCTLLSASVDQKARRMGRSREYTTPRGTCFHRPSDPETAGFGCILPRGSLAAHPGPAANRGSDQPGPIGRGAPGRPAAGFGESLGPAA